jgi:hypothetical protein
MMLRRCSIASEPIQLASPASETFKTVSPRWVWAYDCEAAAGPPLILHRLLYRRIVGVEREKLRLTFRIEDGSTLAILSELGPYESGHFCAADGDVVVF